MSTRRSSVLNEWGWTLVVVCIMSLSMSCGSGRSPLAPTQRNIATDVEARAAFIALRSVGEAIDAKVPVNFTAPYSVTGAGGSAAVTGKKTAENTSSASSSSTRRTSDFAITLSGFTSGTTSVSGQLKWYDNYSSRTSCTSSGSCASASDHSESLTGQGIQVTFEHLGTIFADEVTIEADSGRDTVAWDVKVTTKAGKTFSLTVR